jgi:adenylosuccinate synthase
MNKKVDVIVDLQFGSTGKGLIAGYLAKRGGYDVVINANMPNAGHTFIDDTGRTWIHKVLPNGFVADSVKTVGLGPGSVFSLDRLAKELSDSEDIMEGKRLIIHEAAVVLSESHAATERATLSGIASTMQGSAAAMVQKIMRQKEDSCLAISALAGTEFAKYVVTHAQWVIIMYDAKKILLEGAQGYSLGVNSGFWPYCTSRDCTPTRFLSDCAIPFSWANKVIGTARVHPIRVGNTPDGFSGGHYPDQEETSWEELGEVPETTTVTGRERRVFTFSRNQMFEAIMACQPTDIFLNFCNYDPDLAEEIIVQTNRDLAEIGPEGARVTYTGWGAKEGNVFYEYR